MAEILFKNTRCAECGKQLFIGNAVAFTDENFTVCIECNEGEEVAWWDFLEMISAESREIEIARLEKAG